jgi:microcompartment protein CcmK/EutM
MAMLRGLKPGRRWALGLFALIALATAVTLCIPASRHALLRSAGWALVAQDVPVKADIVVVSTDSLGAGVLEAVDLVKAGFAARVAIFDRRDTPMQRELMRRGAPYIDLKAFSTAVLRSQGVNDIVLLPAVVGTADEGTILQQWCAANSIHSLLFVSVMDHSRRTRRVLERSLGSRGVRVMVRYARWSQFDPDSWWQSRNGQRVQIVESEKLLVDIVRHPLQMFSEAVTHKDKS